MENITVVNALLEELAGVFGSCISCGCNGEGTDCGDDCTCGSDAE